MKYLSLNTHSWIEADPLAKLEDIGRFIIQENVAVIALQEVNQLMASPVVEVDSFYCQPKNSASMIKADNFAKLLVDYLHDNGEDYYWSWTYSHIGYDKYEEGLAILAKTPFIAEDMLVSPIDDVTNYHTRRTLFAHFESEECDLTVANCHFSWWLEDEAAGFKYEWSQMLKRLSDITHQVMLLGDFNGPSMISNQSYDLVCQQYLDMYDQAQVKSGSATVMKKIDGWTESEEPLRIDFGFVNQEVEVVSYRVIFNGEDGPVVSDHYGVMFDIK